MKMKCIKSHAKPDGKGGFAAFVKGQEYESNTLKPDQIAAYFKAPASSKKSKQSREVKDAD